MEEANGKKNETIQKPNITPRIHIILHKYKMKYLNSDEIYIDQKGIPFETVITTNRTVDILNS
jgi:hypothetical protein